MSFLWTEKTESSGKKSENNKKLGKGQHKQRARKNGGKHACTHLARQPKQRHLVDNIKLLLPAILINSLPPFIEKILTNN